jgi:hypothetical protein
MSPNAKRPAAREVRENGPCAAATAVRTSRYPARSSFHRDEVERYRDEAEFCRDEVERYHDEVEFCRVNLNVIAMKLSFVVMKLNAIAMKPSFVAMKLNVIAMKLSFIAVIQTFTTRARGLPRGTDVRESRSVHQFPISNLSASAISSAM